jgi:hypothetical protein
MKKKGFSKLWQQLQVLNKIDPGFPEWKSDILKHFSTAELNLARIHLESGSIQRPGDKIMYTFMSVRLYQIKIEVFLALPSIFDPGPMLNLLKCNLQMLVIS